MDSRKRKENVEERGEEKDVRALQTASSHINYTLSLDYSNICKCVLKD